MPINDGMFTSNTDMWATPQDAFDKLNEEFRFTLDVCAVQENTKCERFFTPEIDGLAQVWSGVCWMNPPYGDPEQPCKRNCTKQKCKKRGFCVNEYQPGIKDWVRKAYESSLQGATVVCLLPARTDTRWFHDYCMKAADIRFIKGRLQFINTEKKKDNAPFPNMIVVFRPKFSSWTQ